MFACQKSNNSDLDVMMEMIYFFRFIRFFFFFFGIISSYWLLRKCGSRKLRFYGFYYVKTMLWGLNLRLFEK